MPPQSAAPKNIRENLARAKAYLRRDDCIRSLEAAKAAVDEYIPITVHITRENRFSIEVSIFEYVRDLNKHPHIRSIFLSRQIKKEPFIIFTRGKEKPLSMLLEALRQTLASEQEKETARKQEEEAKRKEAMLTTGQKLLDNGEFPRGKAVLRRYMEECGNNADVIIDVGERLLKANLYMEAADVFEKSIELFPNNVKGYSGALNSYTGMNDYENTERTYIRTLRQFGAHPKTLLNMAKFYQLHNKKDKAYDFAMRALDKDPSLTEAKELMENLYTRQDQG